MRTIVIILCISLAACTKFAVQPQYISNYADKSSWIAQGKIGIYNKDKGESANFHWHQQANSFNLTLYGNFGFGAHEIKQTANNKIYLKTQDGKKMRANSAQELIYKATEQNIPIDSLKYWLVGLADPNYPIIASEKDKQGNYIYLLQNGWELSYPKYNQYSANYYPMRIYLNYNEEFKVKLVINSWL